MIIYPDNTIEKQSHRPNENWTEREDVITVDDNGDLALKIEQCAPYFERVLNTSGYLIDITPTEKPPEAPKPLTELEKLKLQLDKTNEAIDFLIMGVI